MQKKIREAETEWVNYVIVVGQREMDSGILPVRERKSRKIREMQLEELIKEVGKEIEGKPFLPLSLPRLLSKRPIF
jgi:threonyl-tRNA synthetase